MGHCWCHGGGAGATAGSEDWWQIEKFEREVKNFLYSAKEGIDVGRFKDLLLKDPKAVLMVSMNAAEEKPGLQPLAMRGVVLGASSVKNFESIFANICRASSDKYMKLSANDDDDDSAWEELLLPLITFAHHQIHDDKGKPHIGREMEGGCC